jgi:phosphate acetyltransferase
MSALMDRLRRQASLKPRRLILTEGDDERVARAADRIAREKLADVALIGDPATLKATARKAGVGLLGVTILDATAPGEIAAADAALQAARGERLSATDRARYARDPMYQAATRVRDGRADCFVGGSTRPTADVLRPSIWLIGLAPGVKTVSSFFLMVLKGAGGAGERVLLFTDCAVVPNPDSTQLAEIGVTAADAYQRLTGEVPHTAFLSFSTRGSAQHPDVDKVREAVRLARERRPELHLDGELQLDAAIVPEIGRRKAKDSTVAGSANVLVFPDLDAGNIGYKLVQRLAGAEAIGPIVMGLARQANDLSRGCSADDIVETSTIACLLAQAPATVAGS